MNLKELKDRIDFLYKAYPNSGNLDVVITTNDSSIGARASSNIRRVYRGFDWEHNQIRIEPEDNLIKEQ